MHYGIEPERPEPHKYWIVYERQALSPFAQETYGVRPFLFFRAFPESSLFVDVPFLKMFILFRCCEKLTVLVEDFSCDRRKPDFYKMGAPGSLAHRMLHAQ